MITDPRTRGNSVAPCLIPALDYLARGWAPLALCPPDHVSVERANKGHIKSCSSPGKTPWHTWKEFQTTLPTEDQVRGWFRTLPNGNVGITLGGVSGLIGLDIDGPQGEALLQRLAAGDLPRTLAFTTGKGRRLLFAMPEGVKLRTTPKPGGLALESGELRLMGLGSQTVMPSSTHASGRVYEFVPGCSPDDVEPAPAPGWLIRLMTADAPRSAPRNGSPPADGERITEPGRNTTLTSLAGSMRRRGMTREEIETALLAVNQLRCDPPLEEDEVRGIATSVSGYAPGATPNGEHQEAPSGNGKPDPVPSAARVRTLSTVRTEPVRWLWKPWIPCAATTIVDGDPGLGKSTLSLDIAARVSRGWAMPPAAGTVVTEPADVLLLSAEDTASTTIRPRLEAAGADLTRIHILDGIGTEENERPAVLPFDLEVVQEVIQERKVKLLLIDPLMAYLDGEVDPHKDADIRRVLHRFKIMAEAADAAVLVIRHFNKANGAPALYRGGGSIGITGASRSALMVGKHPSTQGTLVFAPVKINLARHPKALEYTLEVRGDVARIGWGQETDLTADDIIGHPGRNRQRTGDQAADFVRQFLAGGAREVAELDTAMRSAGFSDRSIKEGRRLARTIVSKVGFGTGQRWMIQLSPPAQQEADTMF
jgi:hypothetical protein